MILTDLDLICALNEGSGEAFDQIYRRYWRLLYQAALSRLQDEEQAKDVVQDVFVGLWDKRAMVSPENLKAYLLGAVKNQIFNLVARKKVSEKYFRQLDPQEATVADADEPLCLSEMSASYNFALQTMPDKRKEIYRLRYDEELSTHEIASRLNITQKTVQNQLLKAMRLVRSALGLLILVVS